jgi:CPA2 family monovalent cation:H+ antiporter-2
MEFPLEKLRKIGRKAFVIAISEALGTLVGYIVGYYALNFSLFDNLFLALAISVTSSVLVMRVLEELNVIREEASLLILGVCVIEDTIIISMLAILQSLGCTGDLSFRNRNLHRVCDSIYSCYDNCWLKNSTKNC